MVGEPPKRFCTTPPVGLPAPPVPPIIAPTGEREPVSPPRRLVVAGLDGTVLVIGLLATEVVAEDGIRLVLMAIGIFEAIYREEKNNWQVVVLRSKPDTNTGDDISPT